MTYVHDKNDLKEILNIVFPLPVVILIKDKDLLELGCIVCATVCYSEK